MHEYDFFVISGFYAYVLAFIMFITVFILLSYPCYTFIDERSTSKLISNLIISLIVACICFISVALCFINIKNDTIIEQ